MATTEQSFTGNGSTTNYSFTFPYLKSTDITVQLDATATTNWSLANATTVQFTAPSGGATTTQETGGAPKTGVKIKILRETNVDNLTATFYAGSAIKSEDLNDNYTQNLYVTQEIGNRSFENTGLSTMIGDLNMGEDTDIVFEGATNNDYETTLTVTDPTADRTITIPNVTGTVVTTGDTGTVTAAMLAADSVDSSELVDGSIDTSHFSADCITADEIGDNVLDSEHYAAGSIDGEHIANDAIDSQHYAADSIDADHYAPNSVDTTALAGDAVTGDQLADNAVDSEHYTDASIDHVHLANDVIDGDNIQDNAVDSEHYTDGSIDHVHLAADIIDGDNIQDDVINSEHYVAGSIDNEHLADDAVGADELAANAVVNASVASGAAIAHSKLANVTDGQILVGNGSNVPTAVAVSGDVTIANTGAVTIAANAVEIGMITFDQTTITDSDSNVPTSGAVVDYVASIINPIGGLEVIADDESFPNTLPAAGVVISITDCAGLSVNSSGVSTNGDALDNSTITINGFPSELRGGVGSNADPYVFQSGAGLMVQSTGSSQTYNYHQAMIRESDFVQLSDDINDFNARYRVAAAASGVRTGQCGADGTGSGSYPCDGDMYWNTAADKMYVYDKAGDSGTGNSDIDNAWSEVSSVGEFKLLELKDAADDSSPTYDGGNARSYNLKLLGTSTAASVTAAAQLLISVNGVIQKANSGTSISGSGGDEGFCRVDADTIMFATAPSSGSSVFIVQIGAATELQTPADDTVSQAKIQNGAVDTAQLAADAVDGTRIADNAIDSEHYAAGSIDNEHLADNAVDSDELAAGSVDIAHLATGTDGQIITWNASGVAVAVGPGTDGQVLTSTGAGSPPAFEDAGGGGITREVSNGSRNIAGPATAGDAIAAGGDDNTLYGYDAGTAITTGDKNIAIGSYAGDAITDGAGNIAIGYHALTAEDDEDYNIAIGVQALETQDGAGYNIAIGYQAGHDLDVGSNNIAIGRECMSKCNTIGARSNIGIGNKVCNYVEGYGNTAVGDLACGGSATTSGAANYNTAMGQYALDSITTGDNNTCIGVNAGDDINTGYDNVCIGHTAGNYIQSGFDNVYIGRDTTAGAEGDDGAVVVGANISSKGEYKAHIGGSSGAYNEQNYSTWTTTSDRRIKKNIVNNTTGLDKINQITVRNFEYKKFKKDDDGVYLKDSFKKDSDGNYEKDSDGKYIPENPNGKYIPETTDDEITWSEFNGGNTQSDSIIVKKTGTQVGVIAQELESVLPGLVKTDAKHGLKSVNTDNLVWYLVNAIKELSTKNDALEARIAALEAG